MLATPAVTVNLIERMSETPPVRTGRQGSFLMSSSASGVSETV